LPDLLNGYECFFHPEEGASDHFGRGIEPSDDHMIVPVADTNFAQSLGQIDVGAIWTRGQIAIGEDVGNQAGLMGKLCELSGETPKCRFSLAGAMVGNQTGQPLLTTLAQITGTVKMVGARLDQMRGVADVVKPSGSHQGLPVFGIRQQSLGQRGCTVDNGLSVSQPLRIADQEGPGVPLGPALALHVDKRRRLLFAGPCQRGQRVRLLSPHRHERS
jgi:hypothetical protein